MEEYRELPFWRVRKGKRTSEMVHEIQGFLKRYAELGVSEKSWSVDIYSWPATTEWLFQVNNIEGEGFDTLGETEEAVSRGVLGMEMNDDRDEREKNVWGLNRALTPWFFQSNSEEKIGAGGIPLLLESHRSMFQFTRPGIAGRFRNSSEIVYVDTKDGKHFFMEPARINSALVGLMKRTRAEMDKIYRKQDALDYSRIEKLLKLAGKFFFQYESIHPFVDGNGRTGRVMLAHILQSVTVMFPNVLLVDRRGGSPRKVPEFVNKKDYLECFRIAQGSVDEVPRDLTAMVIEGVYVGWKRLFGALEAKFPRCVERELKRHRQDCVETKTSLNNLALNPKPNPRNNPNPGPKLRELKRDCVELK